MTETATQEEAVVSYSRGDHVRLSKNDVIPSRYRGTVGEVNQVNTNNRVALIVPRRKDPLWVNVSEITKVPYDASRVFKAR